MKDFRHKLAIQWAQEASQHRLSFWKRALLQRHLSSCSGCRSLALAVVEFGYGYSGKTGLRDRHAGLLHRSVMAAYARLQNEGAYLPQPEDVKPEPRPVPVAEAPAPLRLPELLAPARRDPMRPLFAVSLAAAALAVACIVLLSLPWRPNFSTVSAAAADGVVISAPQPTADPSAVPALDWSKVNTSR